MAYFDSQADQIIVEETATGWKVTGQSRVTASIHGSVRHVWPLKTVLPIQRVVGQLQIMAAVVTKY